MYRSKLAEGRAHERMDRDPELRKRVEQLRKRVKKEGKNTAALLKSALKAANTLSRTPLFSTRAPPSMFATKSAVSTIFAPLPRSNTSGQEKEGFASRDLARSTFV
jgi:hypothetical protein